MSLSITGSPPATVRQFTAYEFVPVVSGGTPPYTFALTSGTLNSDFVIDPEAGTITSASAVELTAMTDLRLTATDAAGNTATLGPFSITPQQVFSIVDTGASGRSLAATGWVPPAAVEQVLIAMTIRMEGYPANNRRMFVLHQTGSTSNVGLLVTVEPTAQRIGFSMTNNTAYRVWTSNATPVGRTLQIFAQLTTLSAAGRTTPITRARLWVNGVFQPGEVAWGAAGPASPAANYAQLECFGVSNASVPDVSLGYLWAKCGTLADFGLVNFDDPAERAKFEMGVLDPVSGVVATGIGTLTPDVFVHDTSANWQSGAIANRGAAGAFAIPRINGTYSDGALWQDAAFTLGNPAPTSRTAFTSNNITLNFASARTGGQFANAYLWIDNTAGINFTTDPPSVQRNRPFRDRAGTAGLGWDSGAEHNPGSVAKIASHPTLQGDGARQGYDFYQDPANYHVSYQDSFNIDPGRTGTPLALTSGTLVKYVSNSTVNFVSGATQSGRDNQARAVAFSFDVPPDTTNLYFMPRQNGVPLVDGLGRSAWIISRNSAGVFQPDISMLPNIATPTGVTLPPAVALYNQILRWQSVSHLNFGTARNLAAPSQMTNYGREATLLTGNIALLMCMSALTSDQKAFLAEAMTQYGIFLARHIETGVNNSGTTGMGNTSTGRKMALAIAALVTGNARLQDALASATTSKQVYAEDIQIRPVTAADQAEWPGTVYDTLLGQGEWTGGNQTTGDLVPAWTTGENEAVEYRHNWASAMILHYCAVKAIPGLQTLWNNTLWLQYMERYYQTELGRGFAGDTGNVDRMDNFGRQFRAQNPGLF
ncbi:MAG: hypothetical protein MUE77_06470 [Sandarakinorhabdus sp.]|nr:hypothetical protein [Sandarakinorhabdus sp.]